jgi:drug/metabolite transporter (DMT)-like permease
MIVVCKGQLETLMRLQFTKGDIWISGAMISWAVYSVFLMNWKSKFDLLTRFGLMAIAGVICLLPMYYVEETFFYTTSFNKDFVFWTVDCCNLSRHNCFFNVFKITKVCWGFQ